MKIAVHQKLLKIRISKYRKQVGTDTSSAKWTDNLIDVSDYIETFTRYLRLEEAAPVSTGTFKNC